MTPAEQQNLRLVRRLWATADQNPEASRHPFFEIAHEDVEMQLYMAGGRVLRGQRAFVGFLAGHPDVKVKATAHRFECAGDDVVVHGWVRVQRDGGFAESQLKWTYTFRDGLVSRLVMSPSA